MNCPTYKLSNGYEMPAFGLGTFMSKPNEVHDIVYEAIKLGYRLIDTASAYRNEKEVGQAIKEAIADGLVKREELFITTKLFCEDFAPERLHRAFEQSRKDLQLDYIDLYLIHQPFERNIPAELEAQRDPNYYYSLPHNFEVPEKDRLGWNVERMTNTWRELEKLVEKGEIRSLGISNFTVKKMKEFLPHCKIMPVNNQVELHIQLQQWELKQYCDDNHIVLTSFFPLGNGQWFENGPRGVAPLKNPVIKEIADHYKKTPAQILLRWGVQRGTIVIPKTIHKERLIENMNIFDFSLTEEEMATIKGLDERKRGATLTFLLPGKATLEDVWDGENCN
ncbi:hypothetical protein WA158_005534 [Blastocystis sp. Blastoise]